MTGTVGGVEDPSAARMQAHRVAPRSRSEAWGGGRWQWHPWPFTALAAAVFGTHVIKGGFVIDDWNNAGKTHFLSSCCSLGQSCTGSGYGAQVRNLLLDGPAGYHVGLPVLIPLVFGVFGPILGPHLASRWPSA